jgi:penicillin amidase
MRRIALSLIVLSIACTSGGGSDGGGTDTPHDTGVRTIDTLPHGESLQLPGLNAAVEVVYDDRGIPHIYGTTMHDVLMVEGYVMSRDRFAQMELLRRNVIGRLGEVLGAASPSVLTQDADALTLGYRRWSEAIWAQVMASTDPLDIRTRDAIQAFVAGVNVYIDRASGTSPTENPAPDAANTFNIVLLSPNFGHWRPEDIMAIARYFSASLSYDAGDDSGRTAVLAAIQSNFGGASDPRRGIYADLWSDYPDRADFPRTGFPNEPTDTGMRAFDPTGLGTQPTGIAMQLPHETQLAAAQRFFGRQQDGFARNGFGDVHRGSNNWIVSGSLTASGHPILANDPHLSLISPPIWWYVHLNTARMHGELNLDVEGVTFPGAPGVVLGFNRNVAWGATTTGYDVTDMYLEQITAGTGGAPDTVAFDPGTGTTQVPIMTTTEMIPNAAGTPMSLTIEIVPHHGIIVPGSRMAVTGMPGHFTALSVRYTGSDPSNELAYFAGLLTATNVMDAQAAQQHFRVGSQNFVAIDAQHIRWSTQSRIPQRDPRAMTFAYDANGVVSGYSPLFVLPGTGQYEWVGDLDSRYIPFDQDPTRGWVGTANGDNVGVTLDGNPCNDTHYLGGNFDLGLRVHRIHERLGQLATRGAITTDDMSALQATTTSSAGEMIRTPLVTILQDAHTTLPSLSAADLARLDDVRMRLMAWSLETPHGVGATDATVIADSIATAIFNVSLTRIAGLALDDELNAMHQGLGGEQTIRFLEWGFGMPGHLVTGNALWDNLTTTTHTETREEIAIQGVLAALDYLTTRLGADVTQWRWGMLHTVTFDAGGVGLPDAISIPPPDDAMFPHGFPRHGDFGAIDVGNFGMRDTTDFSHGSGASQRLVVEMTPTGPRAFNAIPGGQVLDPASPHHRDEAALWIQNQAPAIAYEEADIVAHFERRLDVHP